MTTAAMPLISRQYTPKTCTLEINAQTSPLSRWARRPILQSLDFSLKFKDILGSNQQPLQIEGNQDQLTCLSTTVTEYVQAFLGESLALSASPPLSPSVSSPTAARPDLPPTHKEGEQHLDAAMKVDSPYLRSHSLLQHELVLGALSTDATGPSIPLQVSQLFDLVSAMEDCSTELDILPISPNQNQPTSPLWAMRAAGIVVLLGATTMTLHLLQIWPGSQLITSVRQADNPSAMTETESAQGNATPPTQQGTQSKPNQPSVEPKTPPGPVTSSNPVANNPANQSRKNNGPVAFSPRPEATSESPNQSSQSASPSSRNSPSSGNRPTTLEQDRSSRLDTENQPLASQPNLEPAQTSAPQSSASKPKPLGDLRASSPSAEEPALPPPPTALTAAPAAPAAEADSFTTARSRLSTTQVESVQQYLSQRWQVPAGLKQPLEYQLILNNNGSLRQVKPLTAVAKHSNSLP
ncbi:MAG: DUF4335 domain-containing protein, partial [Acaryochloridaceae cyanobacterium CSU_5_19]|nr:DUF4335 domain-containing protein [Acaryochloridaceae cyanobacterium CSU_5_19]